MCAQSVFSTKKITRSVTLWAAYPEDIILPPVSLSGRKGYSDADIAALAADIHKNEQHQPAKVRKNEQGLPVLVYGRRRYLAVKYINDHLLGPNEPKVKLECNYESKMTDTEALIAAISENRFRKDVNDMDHCHNINQLLKRKQTMEDIAQIYFPEATDEKEKADGLRWVRERAKLIELAPEAVEAVREGRAKITTAVKLAKLSPDDQRKALAENKSTLAGKARIKVKDVAKRNGKKPVAVAKPTGPAPKVPSSVYEAAEEMACALDVWETDATEKAQKAVLAAHKAYRKLVPFRNAAPQQQESGSKAA